MLICLPLLFSFDQFQNREHPSSCRRRFKINFATSVVQNDVNFILSVHREGCCLKSHSLHFIDTSIVQTLLSYFVKPIVLPFLFVLKHRIVSTATTTRMNFPPNFNSANNKPSVSFKAAVEKRQLASSLSFKKSTLKDLGPVWSFPSIETSPMIVSAPTAKVAVAKRKKRVTWTKVVSTVRRHRDGC